MMEDWKVQEDKLRVDVRKFEKRERQQKLLNKELSVLRQPSTAVHCGSCNCPRDWRRDSRNSKSSGARTRSSATSKGPDPRKGSSQGSSCFQRSGKRFPRNSIMSEALIKSRSSSFSAPKAPNAEVKVTNVNYKALVLHKGFRI